MNWHIKPLSTSCHVTGNIFETGDHYVSFLVEDIEAGEIHRYDVLESEANAFSPKGDVFCRWPQTYRKEAHPNEAEKLRKASLEEMFLSLFESEEVVEETETLKSFLGLFLQRKNVLKVRGVTEDGKFQVLEHRKTKSIFLVPRAEVTPEALVKIQGVLGEIVH